MGQNVELKEFSGLKPMLIKVSTFFACLLLILSVLIFATSSNQRKDYLQTTATIVEVDHGSQDVYVTFSVGDTVYEHMKYGNYTPYYEESATIEILYNPANPKEFVSKTNTPLILLIVSSALATVAVGLYVCCFIIKPRNIKFIKENGEIIKAQITKVVEVEGRYKINHKRIYWNKFLVCESNGKIFRSKSFLKPEENLVGGTVSVYVKKDKLENPSRKDYYVDIKSVEI